MLDIKWYHYVIIACALFVLSVYPLLPITPVDVKMIGAFGLAALSGFVVYGASKILLKSNDA